LKLNPKPKPNIKPNPNPQITQNNTNPKTKTFELHPSYEADESTEHERVFLANLVRLLHVTRVGFVHFVVARKGPHSAYPANRFFGRRVGFCEEVLELLRQLLQIAREKCRWKLEMRRNPEGRKKNHKNKMVSKPEQTQI
jgi:hypothetical protein